MIIKLTEEEKFKGFIISTCKCCGNVYKSHNQANACGYSFMPDYGCHRCQGVKPSDSKYKTL
jgi:hypothetical protein